MLSSSFDFHTKPATLLLNENALTVTKTFRYPTTDVQDFRFSVNDMNIQIHDMGGQPTELVSADNHLIMSLKTVFSDKITRLHISMDRQQPRALQKLRTICNFNGRLQYTGRRRTQPNGNGTQYKNNRCNNLRDNFEKVEGSQLVSECFREFSARTHCKIAEL